MPMNFEKAIGILGISRYYTEAELKDAYKKLVNKYHPDRNKSPKAEEKMKEINAAKEYLKKHANNHPNNTDYHTELKAYKMRRQQELDNMVRFRPSNAPIKIIQIIARLNTLTLTTFTFSNFPDKKSIDELFEKKVKEIIEEYKKLEIVFYQENDIKKENIKEKIIYNCTLEEFYNQLLNIERKYNKEANIIKRLEKEIEKYKSYFGYDELESFIIIHKNTSFFTLKQNNYKNIEQEISKMHEQITEVFNIYYSLKNKIQKLESAVSAIDDEQIKLEYQKLNKAFQNGVSFFDTQNSINKLKELIRKYNSLEQKKKAFQNNATHINSIFRLLMDRYTYAVKKYNIISESSNIDDLNKHLITILESFKQGCKNFQNLEYFNLFNKITFKNIEEDRKILAMITKKISSPNYKVYMRRYVSQNSMYQTYSKCNYNFYLLDEEQKTMYKMSEESIYKQKLTYYDVNSLENNYISLEDMLDTSTYVGKHKVNKKGEQILVLYETPTYIIYYTISKGFDIAVNKQNEYKEALMTEYDIEQIKQQFQDKNKICDMITGQILQMIYGKEENLEDTLFVKHHDEFNHKSKIKKIAN